MRRNQLIPTWLAIALRALLAGCGGALAIFGVLLQINVYKGPMWIPIVVSIVVGAGTCYTGTRGALDVAAVERRLKEEEVARRKFLKAALGVIYFVANATSIDQTIIGVGIFRVRRSLVYRKAWWKRKWWKASAWKDTSWPLHHVDFLDRVYRLRIDETIQASKVRWMKGKGALGGCLSAGLPWRYTNWSSIVARFTNPDFTVADFNTLTEGEKAGFTYAEFAGIMHKYSEVLAMRVMSEGGGSIIGVIVIDRPYDPTATNSLFNTPAMRSALNTAALSIHSQVPNAAILV